MTDVSAATVTAWVKLMTVSQALLARIEAALKAAGLPPLTWYEPCSRSSARARAASGRSS